MTKKSRLYCLQWNTCDFFKSCALLCMYLINTVIISGCSRTVLTREYEVSIKPQKILQQLPECIKKSVSYISDDKIARLLGGGFIKTENAYVGTGFFNDKAIGVITSTDKKALHDKLNKIESNRIKGTAYGIIEANRKIYVFGQKDCASSKTIYYNDILCKTPFIYNAAVFSNEKNLVDDKQKGFSFLKDAKCNKTNCYFVGYKLVSRSITIPLIYKLTIDQDKAKIVKLAFCKNCSVESIDLLSNDRLLIGGNNYDKNGDSRSAWIAYVNNNHQVKWVTTFKNSGGISNESLIVLRNKQMILGTFVDSKGQTIIEATDYNGKKLWERAYSGTNSENFTTKTQYIFNDSLNLTILLTDSVGLSRDSYQSVVVSKIDYYGTVLKSCYYKNNEIEVTHSYISNNESFYFSGYYTSNSEKKKGNFIMHLGM